MMNLSGIPRLLKNFGQSTVDDAGRLFQHWGKNAQKIGMRELPHAFVSFFGQMTPDLDYLPKVRNFIEASNQVAIVRTFPSAKPIDDSAFKFLI